MSIPNVHHWKAGDEVSALRMNEIKDQINFLRNPPACHVARRLSNQSIAAAGGHVVVFDTAFYDPYEMWDPGDPDHITVTVPGWYTYEGVIQMTNAAVDTRVMVNVYKNSTGGDDLIMRWDQQGLQNLGGNINMRKESTMFLNVGDTVILSGYYLSGSGRSLVATDDYLCPNLRIRWVSN
jgi:hypothetical protein